MSFLGGLTGGFGGAALGSAIVTVGANTAPLSAGLAKAKAEVAGATNGMGKLAAGAAALGPAIAAGVVVAGAAAVKLAVDYEAAFARISALSNASAADVAKWKTEVIELGGETARSPLELADALFFLSSAGLDASQVMPALEASAKAAAAGLGETKDVANVVASALNAYAGSGLTAVNVTDTLVAAVKAGRAEPEEFANSLGRILPIAAQAGVSFDEVAASIASLTNIGLDVNEATTAMRGALMALEAPGSQAAETLKEVGISTDELRQVISEDGILGALRMLEEATGGDIDMLRKIIPNVRALTGVFGLTGQELEKVNAIFHQTLEATGATEKAFNRVKQSAQFKFDQISAQLEGLGIAIGTHLLPALKDLATEFSRFLTTAGPFIVAFFKDLAAAIESATAPMRAFQDLLDMDFSNLTQNSEGILALFDRIGAFGADLGGPFGQIVDGLQQLSAAEEDANKGAALAETASAGALVAASLNKAAGEGENFAESLNSAADQARALKTAIQSLEGGLLGLRATQQELKDAQAEVNRLQRQGKTGTAAYRDAVANTVIAQLAFNTAVAEYAAELRHSDATEKQVAAGIRALGREAGLSKADVNQLIRELTNIPPRVTSRINVEGAEDAKRDVDALGTSLSRVAGTYHATVIYDTQGQGRTRSATGFSGFVAKPTLFLAGEAGSREHVRVSPDGKDRGGGDGATINVYIDNAFGPNVGEIIERSLSDRLALRRR